MATVESIFHKDFQALTTNVMHAISGTAPTGFRLILTNGLVISHASTMTDIAGAELADLNGYTRQAVTFTAGAWDAVELRHELADVSLNLAPSGGSWTFDGYAIVADASATIANTAGTIREFGNVSPAITINNGETYTITLKGNVLDVAYATTGQ